MAEQLWGSFPLSNESLSVRDYLDRSSFDELSEMDLINDRCRNIYHVEGKYFVPLLDGRYRDLVAYAAEHMIHPEDRSIYSRWVDPDTLEKRLQTSEIPGVLQAQFRMKLLDGSWCWTHQVAVGGPQHGLAEGVIRYYIFDIQNQKSREQGQLGGSFHSSALNRDELTGLLRDRAFFSQAESLLAAHPDDWCLIAMDIEHFKLFNDWYGREAGDQLLAEYGALLAHEARETGGVAGYIGQDDFCLFIPFDKARIERLFDRLHKQVSSHGSSTGFLPAFGISLSDGNDSILTLYDQASLAIAHAKSALYNRIRLFRPSMYEQTEKEYHILSDFRRGLDNREFFFCLQPQCRASTRRIVGAEALARWRKADGKIIPPDTFIPILEKYGFITELDKYIWEEVCAWMERWRNDGHTLLPVSINVSPIDIMAMDVPAYLEELVRQHRLSAGFLKIEITESTYVENTLVVRDTVRRLREKGFPVLMDDFGSGYSSLNRLININLDVIKLDAQFLHMSATDETRAIHILESIVNMAKSMALPIIVEGVENQEQCDFLQDLGCRYVQGFYFYRPMSTADFEALIVDDGKIDTEGFIFKSNQQFRIREFMDQNIYSDSMLNNILGAVALYYWHDRDVDIVRFNEQFYKAVNVPDFHDRLTGIQNFLSPDDQELLYALLRQAASDRLNGSSGMLSFMRWDGSRARFLMHFYYLGAEDGGQRFYGSVQDVTQLTTLQNQMNLIARFSSDSMVFLRRRTTGWNFQVAAHGQSGMLALSKEDFERELNDGSFFLRVEDPEEREHLRRVTMEALSRSERFSFPFTIVNGAGKTVKLFMKTDHVHDEGSDVEYLLTFREQDA